MEHCNQKRVAIVHDFLLYPGGAEKVLVEIMALFPHAPIFTLLYDKEGISPLAEHFRGRRIHTSFLQRLPRWLHRHTKWLAPLLPTAPEVFDLRDYDVVISSSGAWSKGIVTRVSTVHVAYVHSPMRFVWDENIRYAQQRTGRREPGILLRWLLSYLRVWDFEAAQRPDVLLANSQYTAQRIAKFYRRDARVVYPPVRITEPEGAVTTGEYFLTVARLSEYKNVTMIVDVCTRLELPLVVIGTGRLLRTLCRRAGRTVRVLGYQDDATLARFYREARALIFGGEEDFGLVMAEALAHGTPVIAYGRGGAQEIVQPGVTGELFYAQTPEVMADGIRRFLERERAGGYDAAAMRARAAQFSATAFRSGLRDAVEDALRAQKERHTHIRIL